MYVLQMFVKLKWCERRKSKFSYIWQKRLNLITKKHTIAFNAINENFLSKQIHNKYKYINVCVCTNWGMKSWMPETNHHKFYSRLRNMTEQRETEIEKEIKWIFEYYNINFVILHLNDLTSSCLSSTKSLASNNVLATMFQENNLLLCCRTLSR